MQLPINFRRPPPAFGLELTSTAIKIVQLRRGRRGPILDFALYAPLPDGLIVDGEIKDPVTLANNVRAVLKSHEHVMPKNVVSDVPEAKTFVELISVPKEGGKTFQECLQTVLPSYLPFPAEEAYIDAQILMERPNAWDAVIGASTKPAVDAYLEFLETIGLRPLALEVEPAAIARAALCASAFGDEPTAVIDLGSSHSNIILIDHESLRFTVNLPLSGRAVTSTIAEVLKISPEEAEKMKRECGLDPQKCPTPLKQILDNMITHLADSVTSAERYYLGHFQDARPVTSVLLCGGDAALPALDAAFANALKRPVAVMDIWHNIGAKQLGAGLKKADSFTTALGLALKALDRHLAI